MKHDSNIFQEICFLHGCHTYICIHTWYHDRHHHQTTPPTSSSHYIHTQNAKEVRTNSRRARAELEMFDGSHEQFKEIRKRYRRLIYCTLRWEFRRCDITFMLNMKAHESNWTFLLSSYLSLLLQLSRRKPAMADWDQKRAWYNDKWRTMKVTSLLYIYLPFCPPSSTASYNYYYTYNSQLLNEMNGHDERKIFLKNLFYGWVEWALGDIWEV